jgi:hypothetical protein
MQTHVELSTPIPATGSIPVTRLQLLTGRAFSGFAAAFLVFDGAVKLFPLPAVVDVSRQLGYQPETIFGIGLVLLACVAVYLIPRTAPIGALLLTAYLGGAVATHVRVGNPLFTHILFPTYVAALLWGGLLLRNPALRVLLPFGHRR